MEDHAIAVLAFQCQLKVVGVGCQERDAKASLFHFGRAEMQPIGFGNRLKAYTGVGCQMLLKNYTRLLVRRYKMIYSIVPEDVVFFDEMQIRQRHIKLYNNVTFEMLDGRIDRIISTNPQDYLKYHSLLGSENV